MLEIGFSKGHLGTAQLWSYIIQNRKETYLIHFDSDSIILGNIIDEMISKSEKYDLIGPVRNYKNNPFNIKYFENFENVTATNCFLFNRKKIDKFSKNENLDELLNKPQNWWDNTFILLRPQWWFVCNHDTYAVEVDEIYTYETINTDWSTIADKINLANPEANITATLPTLNTTSNRDEWESYYTGSLGQERAEKVEQLYAKDFEIFNYTKLTF